MEPLVDGATGGLVGGILVASLLGSPHCVGMCGPFVALTSLGRGPTPRRRGSTQLAYHLGRLSAYVTIGIAAGTIGLALDVGGRAAGIQRTATGLAGLAMIVVGALGLLRALGLGTGPLGPTRGVARVVRRTFARLSGLAPVPRAYATGIATSLMPCGWLYTFAVAAAGTGTPGAGALTMAVFWLGTVPALSVFGLAVAGLRGRLHRTVPVVTALLVVAVGIWTLVGRAQIVIDPAASADPSPETPPCHAK